jgi:sporulation protein YlmC with PRC-barrel domain
MTTFRSSAGLPVVARSSAEEIGEVKHFVVGDRRVRAIHVGGGKKGQLVPWSDVEAFGDDAVVVAGPEVLREAEDDREERAMSGETDMLDRRVIDDTGTELGTVADVEFDSSDGRIGSISVGDRSVVGERLLGNGSFAVVVSASDEH